MVKVIWVFVFIWVLDILFYYVEILFLMCCIVK